MSFEHEFELSNLGDIEAQLARENLQLVSRHYLMAEQYNTPALPYLQGFGEVAFPTETRAFRFDSKTTYGVEMEREYPEQPTITKYVKERFDIYVPESLEPQEFAKICWYRYTAPEGTVLMFEMDESGLRSYRFPRDIRRELNGMNSDDTPVQLELDVEGLVMSALKQKKAMIKHLERLKGALLGEAELVPWNN